MKSFVIKITAVFSIMFIAGLAIFKFVLPQFYLPVFPWVLLFFAITTLLVHVYQVNLFKKDFARFARSNMVITFLKLAIYSAFAIVYIAIDSQNAKIFVSVYFIMYLVFTVTEVLSLVNLKNR